MRALEGPAGPLPPHATRSARASPQFAAGLAAVALAAAVVAAFTLGRLPVSLADVLAIVAAKLGGGEHGRTATVEAIVWSVRGPRVLAAVAVGVALAAAGAAYQSLFRNPLVSPDILGVSGGAAVGAVLGILLALPLVAVQGLAFAFGLGAVALVLATAAAVRGHDPLLVLVLAGVVAGALFGALLALAKVLADPSNQLPAITYWLLGSLAATTSADLAVAVPAIVAGLVPLWLLRWRLNLLSLGDEEARALGVEAGRVRIAVIVAATLCTAAAVAIAGIVGWIGLVIPHFARLAVGPDFGRLLPLSALAGAAFLLVVDTLARTLGPVEIPLGVLTALVGTPLFLWQLAAARRSWQ